MKGVVCKGWGSGFQGFTSLAVAQLESYLIIQCLRLLLIKVKFNHFHIPIFLTVYKGICVNQKYINCKIDTCTSKTKAVTMKHNLKLKNVSTIHNILRITCFKTFNVYCQYLTKTATSKAPTILK